MKPRIRRILKFSVIRLLITVLALTAVFLVYRNVVHKAVHGEREYEFLFPLDQFEVAVSSPVIQPGTTNRRLRVVKLSFPIEFSKWGCEFMFGAAVFGYPQTSGQSTFAYRADAERYLIKFKYDLKSKRCESKDLAIPSDDLPSDISLQLARVELSAEEVRETPLELGVVLKLQEDSRGALSVTAGLHSVPKEFPYLLERVTRRNVSFSSVLSDQDRIEGLVHPRDSLNTRFMQEVDRSIARCATPAGCGSIHGAIAEILDGTLFEALERARAAGVEVDIMTNLSSRFGGTKSSLAAPTKVYPPLAWNWLRGNPMTAGTGERLPMHLKFLIFDGETVISSNSNFNFERFGYSRELTLVYRSKRIASIFEEIWAMTRTTLFYPIKVDRTLPVTILFNADRPRGYSASDRKPYLTVRTETGESANAYGILFELLDREQKPLLLAMSPVSNYCAPYEKLRCLDDLLSQRRASDSITEIMNSFFFFDPDHEAESGASTPLNRKFLSMVSHYPKKPHLMTLSDTAGSLHHERLAVLGDEVIIAGSANWARPSSLNTIEIIRNSEINRTFAAELRTVQEPYFVAIENPSVLDPHGIESHGCRFFFERDLLSDHPIQRWRIDSAELRREVSGVFGESDILLIEPAPSDGSTPNFVPRAIPRTGEFEVETSYLCIHSPVQNRSLVVMIPRR